jgi:glycosyltransferase involved in cell wall biosynthesis
MGNMSPSISEKKMSLLLHTKDNPFTIESGYARWGKYISRGLRDAGWDIAVYAPVGTKYNILTFEGIDVYPGTTEDFCEHLVEKHLNRLKSETGKTPILLQICDIWPLNVIPKLAQENKIKWIATPAIDWYPPTPKYILDKLTSAHYVVPWCKWAEDVLKEEGLKNIRYYIPLGVNTNIFKPINREEYPNTMKSLGFEEDSFNIVIVAANQYMRKPFYEWFIGIKMFMDEHPGVKVRVYVHSLTNTPGGYNLSDLARYCGIDEITRTSDDYASLCGEYSEEVIARIYNVSDVTLMGGFEGFGLPIIESQACGTPVIALNSGCSAEILKSGILVPPKGTFCAPNLMVKSLPHERAITDALDVIYNSPRSRWSNGVEWVKQRFDWSGVIQKWLRLLMEIEGDMDARCEFGAPEPAYSSSKVEVIRS